MRLTDKQEQVEQTQPVDVRSQPLEKLREKALLRREHAPNHLLRQSLSRQDCINIIAEIKRASPWQETIQTDLDPAKLALALSQRGAAAVSVWTEARNFQGSLDDIHAVRAAVSIPVLRKDFITESFQIYETAIAGADAVLLMAAAMDEVRLSLLRRIAEDELGLDALVEVQNTNQMLRAYAIGATLISVNNRSLSKFEVSLESSIEVARATPKDVLLVSENGLSTVKHLRGLHALGFRAFLLDAPLTDDGQFKDPYNQIVVDYRYNQ